MHVGDHELMQADCLLYVSLAKHDSNVHGLTVCLSVGMLLAHVRPMHTYVRPMHT